MTWTLDSLQMPWPMTNGYIPQGPNVDAEYKGGLGPDSI